MKNEIETACTGLGFEKHFPDPIGEKDYFYWRKNIKHPFLNGLQIVCEQSGSKPCINVYVKVFSHFYKNTTEPKYRSEETIYTCEWSLENLLSIMKWLSNT